ncbi:nucleoside deaminase [Kitasatospora sp. GP82]|uniref:nucleoside deaminase n=1 Tax=Kitasatospora sp. GP82 TaxID=3035089 RepID=UPI0024740CB5|nr:nucleoside deaminase [Kitasatospora sp. GP82]MDH6128159.1 guanine deaminase [Kitasatospora sp. GP82]
MSTMPLPSPESELSDYVRQAVGLSVEHVARGGIPFTALVVNRGQVLGTGVNRVREDRDPTAHAEVVAIREAIKQHGMYVVADSVLVASGEPCALCYLTALYSNIGHVVYAADRQLAAAGGFDYRRSYDIFATDPVSWPMKVTSLPVEGARKPFDDYLARHSH